MRIEVHRAEDRGATEVGWLQSRHSFSFNEFFDPKRVRFGALTVLNDDVVQPGMGFPTHPHRDMEIITIVLSGRLEHKDSKGNHGFVQAGEVQRMSAGSGIMHSEMNASAEEPLTLLQIWIEPSRKGLEPTYEQKAVRPPENGFVTVAADTRDAALYIHQHASVVLGHFGESETASYTPRNNHLYIFVITGAIQLCATDLGERDAMAIIDAQRIDIVALQEAEILIFDVPAK